MINVRKGSAHSLAQTDITGKLKSNENVVAGMLVLKDSSGDIVKVAKLDNAIRGSATNRIGTTVGNVGFAVSTYNEGDAIESKKIGVYLLDGGSVVETDQYVASSETLDATAVGKPVVQCHSAGADGKVTVVASGTTERVIGYVYDAPRSIFVGFTATTVLPIKLAS